MPRSTRFAGRDRGITEPDNDPAGSGTEACRRITRQFFQGEQLGFRSVAPAGRDPAVHDVALAELLREFEGDGLGFGGLGLDLEELDALLVDAGEAADDATATDDPDFELPADPWVATGDVYVLGEHRLVVGDASDPAVVRQALGGEQPALLVTDPPYGVAYTGKTREQLRIRSDNLSPEATRQLISTVFGHARSRGLGHPTGAGRLWPGEGAGLDRLSRRHC